jgi:hypothetical protein
MPEVVQRDGVFLRYWHMGWVPIPSGLVCQEPLRQDFRR